MIAVWMSGNLYSYTSQTSNAHGDAGCAALISAINPFLALASFRHGLLLLMVLWERGWVCRETTAAAWFSPSLSYNRSKKPCSCVLASDFHVIHKQLSLCTAQVQLVSELEMQWASSFGIGRLMCPSLFKLKIWKCFHVKYSLSTFLSSQPS